ncbi:serine/threonine protein kinase [Haliangium sp.]|uniref:serine/threonine protein kinase n=1 Tax=Haliangium sp. TaxID=2663208 RepID=UPI003D0D741C
MSDQFPIPFGRYQLLERLAVGGMAELFLARDRGAARIGDPPVVIKRLLPHMAGQPHFKDMFLDEARLTKRLNHPKIAQTYDFGRCGAQLFIAMEFVDGIDALALLRECAHRKVRLPPQIAVYTVQQVLDALDFAHNQVDDKGNPLGVVHRDISPSNVLLSRSGDIKLVDFGIARASQRSHHTKDGTLKGKYGYMSPEQVVDEVIDARSDLFSVGIVLAELLTGRRLFAAASELDVLLMVRDASLERLDRYGRHIGGDLDRILRKALKKRPDERFENAADFREALDDWMRLHNYEVTSAVIGEVVDSFYEDAWQRKRGAVPGALWRAQGSVDGDDGPPGVAAVVMDTAEAEQVQGIPSGHAPLDTESMPVVSIEDVESAPLEARVEDIVEAAKAESDAVVASSIDVNETERVDGTMHVPGVEPITIELVDADDDEMAKTIADFTPGPIDAPSLAEATGDILAGDLMDVPRVPRVPRVPPQPSEPPEEEQADGAEDGESGLAMSFASIDDALDALAPSDDGETGHGSGFEEAPVTASASEQGEPLPAQPDDAGDFADSSPIGVLYRLAVSRATGLLAVGVGGIRKEIYFREGIPEYVSSNVTNELFGEYLVQEGVLSSGELSMALAMMPRYKNRLGDTLVGLNLLTPLEVLRYLTRQVRKKLVDVCTWGRGSFAWYAGVENKREAFPLDLNTFEVLAAGALELPDDIFTRWLESLDNARLRLVPNGRVRPEVFQLGASMRDVCRELDGSRTMADIRAAFAGRGQHDRYLRMLYLLVEVGLATPA